MGQGTERGQGISFVLRLWLEPEGDNSPVWRWQVHHVQTGEQHYFHSLSDVLEFVAERSEVAPPQLSAAK